MNNPTETQSAVDLASRMSRGLIALRFLRHLVCLVYPLALLASAVFLFSTFGPTAWLWLVVLLVLVLWLAGPKLPAES